MFNVFFPLNTTLRWASEKIVCFSTGSGVGKRIAHFCGQTHFPNLHIHLEIWRGTEKKTSLQTTQLISRQFRLLNFYQSYLLSDNLDFETLTLSCFETDGRVIVLKNWKVKAPSLPHNIKHWHTNIATNQALLPKKNMREVCAPCIHGTHFWQNWQSSSFITLIPLLHKHPQPRFGQCCCY